MRSPRRLAAVAAVAAATALSLSTAAASLRAQAAQAAPAAPAAALPPAAGLIARHDSAIGGRAAMDKHTSLHQTATLTIAAMGVTGTLEVFRAKPNSMLQKQTLAMLGEVITGYDGKTAWAMSPQAGAQVVDGDAAAETKGQADFFADYYDPTRIKSVETVELADFEGRKCYKVKLVRLNGTEGFAYFDSETGLRAGQSGQVKMQGQNVERVVVMSDYKDFDGVKMPTKVVQKLGMADIVLQVTAVEFDKVDPAVFALPDAVKALVKP